MPSDAVTRATGPTNDAFEIPAFLFNVIEAQITRADTKAGLVVAADAVFATALLLISRGTLLPVFEPAASPLARLTGLIFVVVFALLFASTLFALIATRPSLAVRNNEATLFFFDRISQLEHAEFIDSFSDQDTAVIRRQILTQIHNNSYIAARKFRRIRYSLDFLVAALFLWAVIQLIVSVTPL